MNVKEIEPAKWYKRFRYSTKKGEISLITPSFISNHMWEIYCTEGDLFEDIERYDTKGEAEAKIRHYLS